MTDLDPRRRRRPPAPSGLATARRSLQLTLARLRGFYREPEAVFWTFGFPILLTIALGIAFRAKPPDPVRAAVVAGPRAEAVRAALAAGAGVDVPRCWREEAAHRALRGGQVAIVVVPGDAADLPVRPDAARRAGWRGRWWTTCSSAPPGGATPSPRAVEPFTEPGARYVDFLVPGLLGMNIMSSGMWGVGWVIVEDRQKKLLKRMVATPMRRSEYLLAFVFMRMLFLVVEVPVLVGFAMLAFGTPLRGRAAGPGAAWRCSARSPSPGWGCSSARAPGTARR